MKKSIFLIAVFLATFASAQVGMGTNTPTTTLEVVGQPATSTEADGITLPKMTGDQLAAKNITPGNYDVPQTGTMIYVTAPPAIPSVATKTENVLSAGTYIWDGTTWARSNMPANSVGIDVGYIVAWTAQTVPPDFLLPISGGTYNKSDYPELMVQHAIHPIQVFASETPTAFTLKNINNESFLKGGAVLNVGLSAGNPSNIITLTQANLPNVTLSGITGNQSADHTHSVDPPATVTSANGNHNHSYVFRQTNARGRNGPDDFMINGLSGGTTSTNGNHTHTINIAASISAGVSANHTHNFTTSSINGGVAQTSINIEPLNTTIIWTLKAKSTISSADLTINNVSPGANSVTTVEIVDNTILTQDISVGGVTTTNILDATILTQDISTGGVTTTNILDGTIQKVNLDPTVGTLATADLKYSILTADHEGWVLMNGRLCGAATLTASQQAVCVSLALPGNALPQTSGGGQNGATYLADIDGNSVTTGSIGGNVDNIWAASDLPQHFHSVNPPNTATTTNGNHNHTESRRNGVADYAAGGNGAMGNIAPSFPATSNNGNHNHTVDIAAFNSGTGNVGGATVPTAPRTFDTNLFIYLGL